MRRAFGTFCFVLFAALGVVAQGTITGRVTDPNGAVWPGANITLSRDSDKVKIQQTTTDNEGEYSFRNIPLGAFQLRVTVSGVNREFTKRIDLNSGQPLRSDVIFSFAPCSDEEASAVPKITTEDHAEIVRSLVGILIGNRRPKPGERKIIFSPDNFSENWLSVEQRSQISVLSRDKIQGLTEKEGGLYYYTITKPVQRGRCVGITLLNNLTVKGQIEDANMAGGNDTYEFRRVEGKWTWIHLSSTIS